MQDERSEAMRAFLAQAGWAKASLVPLPGDASTRRYHRARYNGRTAVIMDQPQNGEMPGCPPTATAEQRQALGYNAMARLAGADCARFVAVARYLRARGLGAPEIYADDPGRGFVLLEDFGDDLYCDVLGRPGCEDTLYAAAIDAIARLHAEPAPQQLSRETPFYDYDIAACLAETDLMPQWFFPLALGRPARKEEITEHRAFWRKTLESVRGPESVFVHRDYHAQNLFWLPRREGTARVGMIDFQDALAGSRTYDVVSLIEDARRDVAPELAHAMTTRYLARMKSHGHRIDEDVWSAEAAVTAAQRNVKIVGIFARLAGRDGKPRYLAHLPRVWNYLESDLAHPALAELRAWYDRTVPKDRRRETPREGVPA